MTQFVTTDSSISTKRTAPSDSNDDIKKRAKASHRPLALDPTSSSTSDRFHQPIFETPTSADPTLTACESPDKSPMDHAITTPDSSLAHSAIPVDIPAVPIEAIGTLQQASTDMLKALVQRDAVDREKQLLIAVGTMRTCLDIHFVPHMDLWIEDARAVKRIPPTPVTAIFAKVSTTTGPPAGAPTGPRKPAVDTESLLKVRQQLSEAQEALRKRKQTINDKDDELARSKEEISRLKTQLVKAKSLAQLQSTLPPKPDNNSVSKDTVKEMEKVIKEQKGKLARQKDAIHNLEKRNAKSDVQLRQMSVTLLEAQKNSKPVPTIPDTDESIAATPRINEQADRIGKQRKQLSYLESQNAKLKAQMVNKAVEKGAVTQRNQEMAQGQTSGAGQGGEQIDSKPTLAERLRVVGTLINQDPPHNNERNGVAGSSTGRFVEPTILRWEDIPSLYGTAHAEDDSVTTPHPPARPYVAIRVDTRSRNGEDRKEVNSRSLWDRMGSQRDHQAGESGQGARWDREQERIEQDPSDAGHPTQDRWEEWRYDNPDKETWAPYRSGEYEEVDGYHGHGQGRQGDTGEDIRAYHGQDGWVYGGPGTRDWGRH